jgi:UDP-N-acetyl-D-glucosamine dehydrogenase
MSFIETACIDTARNMKPGTFISLESTTYPTTTEEFMKPIIEGESGLKEGVDFGCALAQKGLILVIKSITLKHT